MHFTHTHTTLFTADSTDAVLPVSPNIIMALTVKKMNEKSSEECHGAACKEGGSLGLVDGQRCCWIPQTADSEPSRDQISTQGKPPQTASKKTEREDEWRSNISLP